MQQFKFTANFYEKAAPFRATGAQLANQCPLIAGPAVYLARSLDELANENNMYNDAAVCMSQGVSMRVSNETPIDVANQRIIVYPVPAKDIINFDLANTTFGSLTVYDCFGQIVTQMQLQKQNTISLPTINMANGIYRYVLQGEKDDYSGKIIILK